MRERNPKAAFAAISKYIEVIASSVQQMEKNYKTGNLSTMRDLSVLTRAQLLLVEKYADKVIDDSNDWSIFSNAADS